MNRSRQYLEKCLSVLLIVSLLASLSVPVLPVVAVPSPHDERSVEQSAPLHRPLPATSSQPGSAPPLTVLEDATISITDFAFAPGVITVTVGAEIVWVNNGAVVHELISGLPPASTATVSPTPTTQAPTMTPTPTAMTSPTSIATASPTATSVASPTAPATLSPAPPTTTPGATMTPIPTVTASATPVGEEEAIIYLPLVMSSGAAAMSAPRSPLAGAVNRSITLSGRSNTSLSRNSWSSGPLPPGESFRRVMTVAGTYPYYDPRYPTMTGVVLVQENDIPQVTITSPGEGEVLASGPVEVTGIVSDDGPVTVQVNNVVATVSDGLFTGTIALESGYQAIQVAVVDDGDQMATASRMVAVDDHGPRVTIELPRAQQSVYTHNPAVVIRYDDFLSDIDTTSVDMVLADNSGATWDITGDLAITTSSAEGTVAAPLAENNSYTLTISLADTRGNLSEQQVTFYVPPNADTITPPAIPADNAGWVSGRVYDSSTCDTHLTLCKGLPGATVTLARIDENARQAARSRRAEQLAQTGPTPPVRLEQSITEPVPGTVVSGPDGFFAFPADTTGRYLLRVEADGYTYGQRIVEIVRQHSTPVNEIYLTPLDDAVTDCDASGCMHVSSDGQMQVEVPPDAIATGDLLPVTATEFDRVHFLPSGELPPGTIETYAFNLGGDSDYAFQQPVTVRIRNSRGFAPGAIIPLGYWNPELLQWEHAGESVVDASGEWVEMSVNHFSNYDPNYPTAMASSRMRGQHRGARNTAGSSKDPCGSRIGLQSCELLQHVTLPGVQDPFGPRTVTFEYDSRRAIPDTLIEVELQLDAGPDDELGDYVRAELFIEGEKTANFTFDARTSEHGEAGVFRYLWDCRDGQGQRVPAGVYRYGLHVQVPYRAQYYASTNNRFGAPPDLTRPTGVFTTADVDDWLFGSVYCEGPWEGDAFQHPFGVGWDILGLQRLQENEAGDIVIVDEMNNVTEYSFPARNLLRPTDSTPSQGARQGMERASTGPLTASPDVAAPGDVAVAEADANSADVERGPSEAVEPPRESGPVNYTASKSATVVSGTITADTTWTTDNSPYILDGEVVVVDDVTLTIDPAVTVQGQTDALLVVQGTLQANGTADRPVLFTSVADSGPGQWDGLFFDGGAGALTSTIVRHAGDYNETSRVAAGVAVRDSAEVEITGSTIARSDFRLTSVQFAALLIEDSTVSLVDSLIEENGLASAQHYGLFATGSSNVSVSGVTFRGNHGHYALSTDSSISVTNTTFEQSAVYAMRLPISQWSHVSDLHFNGAPNVIAPGTTTSDLTFLTAWNAAAYQLEGQPVVAAGTTMTAEAGIEFRGQPDALLVVQGTLQANGAADRPVLFTSVADSGPGQWDGLFFDGGAGALTSTIVRHAGDYNETSRVAAGVAVHNLSDVRMDNSLIANNGFASLPGFQSAGIEVQDSTVHVEETVLDDALLDLSYFHRVLYSDGASTVSVVRSTFRNHAPPHPPRIPVTSLDTLEANVFVDNGYERIDIYAGNPDGVQGPAPAPGDVTIRPQIGLNSYRAEETLVLDNLRVEPGTVLLFDPATGLSDPATGLEVQGLLTAVGELNAPILFTSSEPGRVWNGIQLVNADGSVAPDRSQLQHVIIDHAETGLHIQGRAVSVRYSAIRDNSENGLLLTGASALSTINGSDISGNGQYGIRNDTGTAIDATTNWWGSSSGPYHPTFNPDGQGDRVSDDVVFEPFITSTEPDVIVNRTEWDPTQLVYDSTTGTYARHYPDGSVVYFDLDGRHASTVDADGNRTVYGYATDGAIRRIATTPVGEAGPSVVWDITYTAESRSDRSDDAARAGERQVTVTDPAGRHTIMTISEHEQLREVLLPDGTTMRFAYSAEGLMTLKEEQNGLITRYEYNEQNRIRRVIKAPRPIASGATDRSRRAATLRASMLAQEVRSYTNRDSDYQLVNNLPPGTPEKPNLPLVRRQDLINRTEVGLLDGGEEGISYQGHSDRWGNTTDLTDAEGRTFVSLRDEASRVTRAITAEGHCLDYTFDARNNLLNQSWRGASTCDPENPRARQVQDEQERSTRYSYEPRFNQVKTVTAPNGETLLHIYDYEVGVGDAGNVIRIEYPAVDNGQGEVVTPVERFTYNEWGLLETESDTLGTVTRYVYTQGTPDEAAGGSTPLFLPGVSPRPGLLTRVIEDDGGLNLVTVYRDFDAAGNTGAVIAPAGRDTTRYTYDKMNRVTKVTEGDGFVTLYEYDSRGNLIRVVEDYTADGQSGRNIVTTYEYDAEDRVTRTRTVDDGGLVVQSANGYDVNGNLVLQRDGLGRETRWLYDQAGLMTGVIDPAGNVMSATYTLDRQIEREIDPEGHVTRYVYDEFGLLTTIVQDEGGLDLTSGFTYDANGNLLTRMAPDGTVTCYEYDALDRLISRTADCGGINLTTSYVYDLDDNLIRAVDWRGTVTTMEYDALDRVTLVRADVGGLNLETRYTYDEAGNLATTTNERGAVLSYSYDELNRMVRTCEDANGLNLCTTYGYDRLNNLATVTDPQGKTTHTEFNAFGLPVRMTENEVNTAPRANVVAPPSATTRFTYDNVLNLVSLTDTNGNTTRYSYDPRNLPVTEVYADGTGISREYDARANLALLTDEAGRSQLYSYDGVNRVARVDFSTGGFQTIQYDAMSRMVHNEQVMQGHTTVASFDYNALGDVVSSVQEVDGQSWAVNYGFSYATGAVTITYPSGVIRVRESDTTGRLAAVRRGDGSLVASMAYNDSEGSLTTTYGNDVELLMEYDPLYRTTRVRTALHDGGPLLADYRYAYDAADNVTYKQYSHLAGQPADVYQYDGLNQLTELWYGADATEPGNITTFDRHQRFDLDSLGNRLTMRDDDEVQTYHPQDGLRLTDPLNRYRAINDIARDHDSNGNLLNDGRNSYSYDILDRQTGLTNGSGTVEYIYDGLNRRVARSVDGELTYYIYDQNFQVIEERNGDGALAARYTYGAGLDRPLTLERGGQSYYYHHDALGSITEISNAAGELAEQVRYDVYGQPHLLDGAGNPLATSSTGNPYFFTARRYDTESGNYYYRNRYYDAATGRFLSPDPLGFGGGDANLYRYAGNNPLNRTDPMGLADTYTRVLRAVDEYSAGFSDVVTFGATTRLREWIFGRQAEVAHRSRRFRHGQYAGVAHSVLSGTAAARVLGHSARGSLMLARAVRAARLVRNVELAGSLYMAGHSSYKLFGNNPCDPFTWWDTLGFLPILGWSATYAPIMRQARTTSRARRVTSHANPPAIKDSLSIQDALPIQGSVADPLPLVPRGSGKTVDELHSLVVETRLTGTVGQAHITTVVHGGWHSSLGYISVPKGVWVRLYKEGGKALKFREAAAIHNARRAGQPVTSFVETLGPGNIVENLILEPTTAGEMSKIFNLIGRTPLPGFNFYQGQTCTLQAYLDGAAQLSRRLGRNISVDLLACRSTIPSAIPQINPYTVVP